jgi:hypothetical protein
MAHPIIGPVDVLYHSGGALAGAVFVKRRIYKQSKPYDLQLPYNAIYRYTLSASVSSSGTLTGLGSLAGISDPSTEGGGFTLYTDRLGYDSPETQQVLAKARAKFSNLAAPSAEMLVNLIEARQSLSMITRRFTDLLKFAKACKRLDVKSAKRVLTEALSLRSKDSHRDALTKTRKAIVKAKSPAGMWLELHFGWAPLCEDLVNGMDLLQGDFKPRPIFGKSSGKFDMDKTLLNPPDQPGGNGHDWSRIHVQHWRHVRARVGAVVRIENPNLLLASRLGFVNPFSVINELVPFSFVLDWFSNWSQWLGAYSEFYGLSIENAYHTVHIVTTSQYNSEGHVYGFGSPPPHWDNIGNLAINAVGVEFRTVRTPGIPDVTLGLRLPAKLSLSRAATACSLLVQLLSTNGYDPKSILPGRSNRFR